MKLLSVFLYLLISIQAFAIIAEPEDSILTIDHVDTNKQYIGKILVLSTNAEGIKILAKNNLSCYIPFSEINLVQYEKDCDGAYQAVPEEKIISEFIEMFANAKNAKIECSFINDNEIMGYKFLGQTEVSGKQSLRLKSESLSDKAFKYYEQRREDEKNPLEPVFNVIENGLKAVLF